MYEKEYESALTAFKFWSDIKSEYENIKANGLGNKYPECAYKAYIFTGSLSGAAKLLNERNYYVPGRYQNGNFQPTTISSIIDYEDIEDKKLQEITRKLFKFNRYRSSKYH